MANPANIININERRRAMLDDSAEPDRGYIQLHRKLLDQPFNRCPVKSSVWMYLLLNASHKPYRTYLNGQMVVLQAGQIVTGRKKIVRECFDQDLMEVTEAMVRGALNRFVKEEMISVESTRSGSIITIINWDRYQGQKPTFANQPLTKGANQPSNLPVNQAQPTNDAACREVLTNPLTSDLTNPKPTPLTTIQEDNTNTTFGSCPSDDEPAKQINSIPLCPHAKIIDLYHELLPELPKVIKPRWGGSARARDLQARWKENPEHQNREFWTAFFAAVRSFPHQMGDNDRGWKADLGWLVKRANFDKMIERFVNQGVWGDQA